ncbi:MAG: phosphate ABC transporter permease PstA [Desulfobulbaceae bacterium]|nr:phosphate ABC transporter permease PstA [Desulfobulbaceae bacterium]
MSKKLSEIPENKSSEKSIDIVRRGMVSRYRAEKRFRLYGIFSVIVTILFLGVLFVGIGSKGFSAFQQTYVRLEVYLDPEPFESLESSVDYPGLIKNALRSEFPEVKSRRDKKELYQLVSSGASFQLRDLVRENSRVIGKTISIWVPADDDVDMYLKGHFTGNSDGAGRLSENQLGWIQKWVAEKRVEKRFNKAFFINGDSREPEQAGILGALTGSILTIGLTVLFSFPIGVATAVYLEEFAPKNRWIDFVEVNINNLAAVPSIVFGLLGLAVFINFFNFPRSSSLVGGLVLSLMTMPTIIIAGRASIQSVPPSIREAALGIGASPMQTVLQHVLPLALPGILTGTIIGMARALGETAPLLMIGMVAFIVDIPHGVTDPATVLPVQVYLWADSPERAFTERTSAAIMVLLAFLVAMNSVAVWLRHKMEKKSSG